MDRTINLLTEIVRAYDEPSPHSNHREPIFLISSLQANHVMHHAFDSSKFGHIEAPELEELQSTGLIDIEYTGNADLKFVPTAYGRSFLAAIERVDDSKPAGDASLVAETLDLADEDGGVFAWGFVVGVLRRLMKLWEARGFPSDGLPLPPIYAALEDGEVQLLAATVLRLYDAGYVDDRFSELKSVGGPAEIVFTEKSFQAVAGWPGGSNNDIATALIAAVADAAESESDEGKKGKLDSLSKAARDLGVETLSEVLAKIALGGV